MAGLITMPPEVRIYGDRAYHILHVGYTILPLLAGADKFTHLLTDWEQYLAPVVLQWLPVDAHSLLRGVGVVEIAAGVLVAILPRFGGLLVAVWLWAIMGNLLLTPDYYDIALRDFGLSLGALALSALAAEHHAWKVHARQRQAVPWPSSQPAAAGERELTHRS